MTRRLLASAIAFAAAGCSMLVSFDEPPVEPELVEDAGPLPGRDAKAPPSTASPGEEDAAVVVDAGPPCDPDFSVSSLLFDDTLAKDSGKLAPGTGFPAGNWAYNNGNYNQTQLRDGADATLFGLGAGIEDVDVQISAASAQVSSNFNPRLRQIFILVGVTATADAFAAYGCGIEIVEGLNPEPRTSVVQLSGTAAAVKTTSIERTARQGVNINEVFKVRAHVKAGTLTCTVTQGANTVTTAKATGRTDLKGGIGLFTRQTRGTFQRARVCRAL